MVWHSHSCHAIYNKFNETVFPQKGPCWSFELNRRGKQAIFQFLTDVDFLAALAKALKLSQKFSHYSRDGMCYVPHFSQPIILQGVTLPLARSPRWVSKVSGERKSSITRPFGEYDFNCQEII